MTDDVAYPSVELILDLHEQIVEEGDATEPGIRSEDAIESAVQYVSEGYFGEVPQTLRQQPRPQGSGLVSELPLCR